jgi:phosphoglycerate dehydrogenase-like enzyme
MKNGSYFINTARGEIVGNAALKDALLAGKIIGAGLDTVAPEPVQEDHMLLHLPEEIQRRVIITPHIAGVTTGFFRRAHRTIWENIQRVKNGEEPVNQV